MTVDLLDLAYPEADETELNKKRVEQGQTPKRAKPSTPSAPIAKAIYFFLTRHECENCGRVITAPTELYPKPFILYHTENRGLDHFVPYTGIEDVDLSTLPRHTRESYVSTPFCVDCFPGG